MHVRHFVTIIAVVLCVAAAATAQSTITLQGGLDQSVTFSSDGAAGVGANLGACTAAGACRLYGLASGNGSLSAMGLFLLQSSAGAITFAPGASGALSVVAGSPAPGFALYGFDETTDHAGLLLSGTLNLTGLTATAGGGGGGSGSLEGNLMVTAGLLAGALGSGSLPLQLNLQFPAGAGIGNLVGLNGTLTTLFAGGSVGRLTPAPEPADLALLALGALLLVGFAAAIRRRSAVPSR